MRVQQQLFEAVTKCIEFKECVKVSIEFAQFEDTENCEIYVWASNHRILATASLTETDCLTYKQLVEVAVGKLLRYTVRKQ